MLEVLRSEPIYLQMLCLFIALGCIVHLIKAAGRWTVGDSHPLPPETDELWKTPGPPPTDAHHVGPVVSYDAQTERFTPRRSDIRVRPGTPRRRAS